MWWLLLLWLVRGLSACRARPGASEDMAPQQLQPQGRGTDLASGLMYLRQVAKRKAVTFLILDFMARDYEKPLRLVGRKHDLVPVVIADPLEIEFPKMGLVEMEDPETGDRFVVDTSDPRVRGRYARFMQAQRQDRLRLFKKLELDTVELRAGDDHGKALAQFFRARARRMAA